jgi:hypothetical protein
MNYLIILIKFKVSRFLCRSVYINFPGYIPNLTFVKDNLQIYNKLMFLKTLPKRTRKMLFNIRAVSVFRYSACFAALG